MLLLVHLTFFHFSARRSRANYTSEVNQQDYVDTFKVKSNYKCKLNSGESHISNVGVNSINQELIRSR